MIYDVIDSITADMTEKFALLLKNNPSYRKSVTWISVLLIMISTVGLVLNNIYFNANEILIIVSIVILFTGLLSLIIVLRSFVVKERKSFESILDELSDERKALSEGNDTATNVLEVIRKNLNQLNEYYVLNKLHSSGSYRLSVITISIGFVMIIGSVMYMFITKEVALISVILSISGVISEFIGATTFSLYKESNKNVDKFFIELTKLQRIMLAIELTSQLESDFKNKETAKVISALVNYET